MSERPKSSSAKPAPAGRDVRKRLWTARVANADPAAAPRSKGPARGAPSLGRLLPKAAAKILKRRGFAEARILGQWAEIVGPELARMATPERLTGRDAGRAGTLVVKAEGGAALALQHQLDMLIERINTHCGEEAVARIRLVQTSRKRSRRRGA